MVSRRRLTGRKRLRVSRFRTAATRKNPGLVLRVFHFSAGPDARPDSATPLDLTLFGFEPKIAVPKDIAEDGRAAG
jgi:hypothetical protein